MDLAEMYALKFAQNPILDFVHDFLDEFHEI